VTEKERLLTIALALVAVIGWATASISEAIGDPIPRHLSAPQSVAGAEIAAVRRLASDGLPLFCGGPEKPMVALTFDDGPGVYTHYAIQKLREAHLHATFFLVGKEIVDWPGIAQREKPVAAFGDHTMTHPFLRALSRAQAAWQIAAAQRLIERTVHEPVLLFRPPYEAHTRAIDSEVKRLGMVEVLWNVDSADSLGGNYHRIERYVIAGLHPGSIILMHENHGQTIRALDVIFAALKRRHLQAVTVPRLIAEDPPSLAQLRRGYSGCAVRLHHSGGG
jgi:peptidoglycan/xylan/chitin deacetylase (PgdA/CDA1 family)